MRASHKISKSILNEPKITDSILASIPDCLKQALHASIGCPQKKRKSILFSSNSLANKFIFLRWGIRPSQRRRYRNLFSAIRRQCRIIFQNYLSRGRIEWDNNSGKYVFGVFKFDEIRGNLILGFVAIPRDSEWTLPINPK